MARYGRHQTLKQLSLAMVIRYQPQPVSQQIFQEKRHQFTNGLTTIRHWLIFQLYMEEFIPGMSLLTAEMSARQAGMFPPMLNWKHSKLILEGKLLPVDR